MERLDWNKTKTIFIVAFSILNIFLYSLYLDRYQEAQSLQTMGEVSISDSLKSDGITYGELPEYNAEMSYVTADTAVFTKAELAGFEGQDFIVSEETTLYSMLKDPFKIKVIKGGYQFDEFLQKFVPNGNEYLLWEVFEEEGYAIFFQKVEGYPIYFNPNAMLTVYWDKEGKITNYEQQRFGDFDSFNKKKDILSPLDVINTLYSRDYLPKESTVTSVSLGYSTLITLTKTQVFAPTWRVRVELKEGGFENHFVNAIEGKIVDFQPELTENDEE